MQRRYFTAIIEAGGKSGYGIYFPDLPGCVSAGDTIEEAARNAEEALGVHLRGIVEDGDDIPTATVPEKISAVPGSAARFLVRGEAPSRAVRLNISLDESLVAKIDRAAKTRAMSGVWGRSPAAPYAAHRNHLSLITVSHSKGAVQ